MIIYASRKCIICVAVRFQKVIWKHPHFKAHTDQNIQKFQNMNVEPFNESL